MLDRCDRCLASGFQRLTNTMSFFYVFTVSFIFSGPLFVLQLVCGSDIEISSNWDVMFSTI